MSDCPVKLLQEPSELKSLIDIYRKLSPEYALEVGSLYGGTLYYWVHYMPPGGTMVSVDKIADNAEHPIGKVLAARELWDGWAETAMVDLIKIVGVSSNIVTIQKVADYAPFDFIFVDGGHDYETVSSDYQNYWPMLRKGGVMAFHDIASLDENSYHIDVGRWWREMNADDKFDGKTTELIAKHGKWGIGVIKK